MTECKLESGMLKVYLELSELSMLSQTMFFAAVKLCILPCYGSCARYASISSGEDKLSCCLHHSGFGQITKFNENQNADQSTIAYCTHPLP